MGQKLFDIFTLSHLLGGFLAYNFRLTFLESNIIHIIYEILDDKMHTDSLFVKIVTRVHKLKKGKTPDALVNSITDQIAFILGYYIGKTMFPKPLYERKYWYVLFLYPSFGTYGFWKLRKYLVSLGIDRKYL